MCSVARNSMTCQSRSINFGLRAMRSWSTYSRRRPLSAAAAAITLVSPRRPSRACRLTRCCFGSDDQLTIADLQQQLSQALAIEDYKLAATIRDELQRKQIDGRLAVEEANRSFYEAFASGDMKQMEQIWGQGDHIQVLHPANDCIAGREEVMESWRKVLRNVRPRAFRIDLEDVRIYATEAFGYVTCVEVIDADDSKGRIAATNVFEKQNGRWVMTHHHGAPTRLSF